MAKAMANAAGVDDAWMVENAQVTEGTSNNAYIVRADGSIQTRQLGHEILHGVTRAAIIVLCRETGREVIEHPFSVDQAKAASEAFVTSASLFVMPVVEIDGTAIGSGRPGPVTAALRDLYIRIARERQSFN